MRNALARADVLAIVFSIKSYAAAIAAYYVALSINLDRPYWAVITAYIVSQPLSGVSVSKALYRLAGTLVGAAAAVILVPNLGDPPELLSLALAAWLGLCTYLGALDRTARGYAFLLAGYTASIIGFPSVDSPQDIFLTASLRVQEISIGLICASLVHVLILPQSVTSRLLQIITEAHADLLGRTRDILGRSDEAVRRQDRFRVAQDLGKLNQLLVHLPYDTSSAIPSRKLVGALQDLFARALIVVSALDDRLDQLEAHPAPLSAPLLQCVEKTRKWMEEGAEPAAAKELIAMARMSCHRIGPGGWVTLMEQSCFARMAEIIEIVASATEIIAAISNPRARPLSDHAQDAVRNARSQPLHRDRLSALQGALTTSVTVLLGCIFWIATGWSDGGTAVLISGVICALFSSLDGAAATLRKVLVASVVGMIIAAAYRYAVIPSITEFPALMAVLAPAFILIGFIYANPRLGPYALGVLLTLPATVGFYSRYEGDFASFANAGVAQLIGTGVVAVTTAVFHPDKSGWVIKRLFAAAWEDLEKAAAYAPAGVRRARYRLATDRIALLETRLGSDQKRRDKLLGQMLALNRCGAAIEALWAASPHGKGAISIETGMVLAAIRTYSAKRGRPTADGETALLTAIDRAICRALQCRHQQEILALASLRRNIFPAAPVPAFS
jgi:uncharacterized membrane protein YccC